VQVKYIQDYYSCPKVTNFLFVTE